MDKYRDLGLSGMANLGNTCFINSCMQILSHTYELNDFLEQGTFRSKLQKKFDSALLIEWDGLRKLLWAKNCIISPDRFISVIHKVAAFKGREMFTGYSQNDVPEFLLFVIDCFHTALSREIKMTITGTPQNDTDKVAIQCLEMVKSMYSKQYSEVWNLFYAVHVSEIIEVETGKQLSITPEPYFMVDLPIPPTGPGSVPTLMDCFDLYVSGEHLTVRNSWYEGGKDTLLVQKKLMFWSLPNVLVIDLKRFNMRFQKSQVLLDFPLEQLDLSKYVVGYKKESYVYNLYAVCNHSGGVMGGHYTAYIKNANGRWYHFNDTSVSEIGPMEVVSSKAYVLFYRLLKKNSV